MLGFKSPLNLMMLLSVLFGLIFIIGCGGSAEKQEMSELLKLYGDAVIEFQAAGDTEKAQLREKIESYRHKWSARIGELNDKVTPQVMNELEREFKKITKKYASLNS